MPKETFEARSQDLAAYLYVFKMPYLGCYRNEYGRVRYLFGNPDDAAWQLSLEFRDGTNALVNAPQYAAALREMMTEARKARVQGELRTYDYPAA